MVEVDIDKVLDLICRSSNITYESELVRRINAYNKLRVRDMDYILDAIRYEGLNNDTYKLFDNELRSLPKREEI